jgi:hypothetical protein
MHFRSHHNGVACVEAKDKFLPVRKTGITRVRKKGAEETLIMYRVVTRRNNSALISSSMAPAFRFLNCRGFTKSRESRQ